MKRDLGLDIPRDRMLTVREVAKILERNLAEANSDLPWGVDIERPWVIYLGDCRDPETPKCRVDITVPLGHLKDAELLVRAVNNLPAVIAELKRLREILFGRLS